MASFLLTLVVNVGLIEIGQAIANPWGTDPEDFAVPTFLHTTAKCARVILETEDIHPVRMHARAHTCMHAGGEEDALTGHTRQRAHAWG